ncbi:SH3 domain-containing protein [Fredinandcohnia sp. QZ13]|uniref:SH3 domain-containing protein n=1 Tax=Fredinandcohnia sp. QZ13 TaxID=3073144 RepID=UPI002852F6BE|nr:SH3 domain-containing protein [Fredinandcohnia sp. QZ13]MDR4890035.1 SH3 domain-containing protein [Fredinandcohnia sp. QZ13]
MKKLNRWKSILSFFICMLLLVQAIPVYASEITNISDDSMVWAEIAQNETELIDNEQNVVALLSKGTKIEGKIVEDENFEILIDSSSYSISLRNLELIDYKNESINNSDFQVIEPGTYDAQSGVSSIEVLNPINLPTFIENETVFFILGDQKYPIQMKSMSVIETTSEATATSESAIVSETETSNLETSDEIVENVEPKSTTTLKMATTQAVTAASFFKATKDISVHKDTTSGTILGTLPAGKVLKIAGDAGDWYKINLGDDQAFVKKQDTTVDSGSLVPNKASGSLSSKGSLQFKIDTNVYEDLSVSPIVTFFKFKQGVTISYIQKVGYWYQVQIGDLTGFVHQNNVTVAPSFGDYVKATSDVPVYKDANTTTVVGFLQAGKVVKRTGETGDWHKINFGDGAAYIQKQYTTPDNGLSIPNKVTSPATPQGKITFKIDTNAYEDLNVSPVVTFFTFKKGITYSYIQKVGYWYQIQVGDLIGYVHQNNVTVTPSEFTDYIKVTSDVPVYKDANTTTVVGILQSGKVVKRTGETGDWHKINFGDGTAYIQKGSTIPDSGTLIPNKASGTASPQGTIQFKIDTNAYEDLDASPVVTFFTFKQGVNYSYIKKVGYWYQVQVGDLIGYVHQNNVTVTTNFSDYVKVTSDTPIYKDTNETTVVGILQAGKVMTRTGETGDWHKISFGEGTAHIKKQNTIPDDGTSVVNKAPGQATSQGSIQFKIDTNAYEDLEAAQVVTFFTFKQGVTYPYLEKVGYWYKVQVGDLIGYVHQNNVITTDYVKAGSAIPVYKDTTSSTIVGTLHNGKMLKRSADLGNWHQIDYGDGFAYIKKESTSIDNGSSVPNKTGNSPINQGTIQFTNDALVYEDLTSNPIVPFFTFKKGTTYSFIEKDGYWYKLQIGNLIGYVHQNNVNIVFEDYIKTTLETPIYQDINLSNVVGSIPQGSIIKRLGDENDNLHKIQFGDSIAYVQKYNTLPNEGKTVTNKASGSEGIQGYIQFKNDTNIYQDLTSNPLKSFVKINKGVSYPYIKKTGYWYQIKIGDLIGYVHQNNIVDGKYVLTERLSIYDSYNSAVNAEYQRSGTIGTLHFGDKVTILENSGYTSKIVTSSGQTGWVFSNYLYDDIMDLDWITRVAKNIRYGPSTAYGTVQSQVVPANTKVKVLDYTIGEDAQYKDWYKILLPNGTIGWMWGGLDSTYDVGSTIHPYDFSNVNNTYLGIHTPLHSSFNITGSEINSFIAYINRWNDTTNNMMIGMGDTFVEAAKSTGINVLYLVAHASLETGYGKSAIVKDKYNYFGIAAYDRDPYGNAYSFATKEEGIKEGARWINNNYTTKNQDTVHSMRNNNGSHQYATDDAWHLKIVNIAKNLVNYVLDLRK